MDSEDERRRVTQLLRFVGAVLAGPALSIAGAFLLVEGFGEHALHIVGLGAAGLMGVWLLLFAPRLAVRWA
ncbi:MAG TPA: hypothetical protein VI796_07315 [Candidatus Thermoplasmatota archaeon]|nr:hypothetical protein [Candidatus Thermoplasmatota archaeon]